MSGMHPAKQLPRSWLQRRDEFGPCHAASRFPRVGGTFMRGAFFVWVLSVVGACSSGNGCGTTYTYPASGLADGVEPVARGARVRMTQLGLDFVQARLPILLQAVDGSTVAEDPEYPAFYRIEITDPIEIASNPRVALAVDGDGNFERATVFRIGKEAFADALRFAFVEETPEGIAASVRNLPIGIDGRLFTGVGSTEAACELRGDNNGICPPGAGSCDGAGLLATVSFGLVLSPRIAEGNQCNDPSLGPCLRLSVEVTDVELSDLDGNDLDVDPAPRCGQGEVAPACSPECSDTTLLDSRGDAECQLLCGAQDVLAGIVTGIAGALESALGTFLEDWVQDALAGSLQDLDGEPARISDRISLAELLVDVPSLQPLDLGFLAGFPENGFDVNCPAGADCEVARGMDILLSTGTEPAPDGEGQSPHPCVVPIQGEAFAALYGENGFQVPEGTPLAATVGGAPYHVGVSLARAALNQALWGIYHTGALCFELTSDDIDQLSEGAFSFRAGTLNTLTGGRLSNFASATAPAILTLMPRQPPVAQYGVLAEGGEEPDDIVLTWNSVEVSAYVYAFDRFVRLFAVDVHLEIGLQATVDPRGEQIDLVVSRGPILDGYETRYAELLPDVEFAEVLESILGAALEPVLSQSLSFSFELGLDQVLTEAIGTPLGLDFQGVEYVAAPQAAPGADKEFMNLYFSLRDGTATDAGPTP